MFLWNIAVTSLAEVWIEMQKVERIRYLIQVTSLAEVWIEIEFMTEAGTIKPASLPLRKCGLKFPEVHICFLHPSHFPCGSVD